MLVIALFLIILGVVLTASLVFGFIGIPLIVIGVFVLIGALLKIIFGTLGDAFYLLGSFFRIKPKKPKEKIIDVEKKDGVYQKK